MPIYLSETLKPIDFPAFPAGLLPSKALFSLVFDLINRDEGSAFIFRPRRLIAKYTPCTIPSICAGGVSFMLRDMEVEAKRRNDARRQ